MSSYPEQSWYCPKCGRQNQISFKFCTDCGTALPPGAVTNQSTGQPTPPKKKSVGKTISMGCLGLIGLIFVASIASAILHGALSRSRTSANLPSVSTSPSVKAGLPLSSASPSATLETGSWSYVSETDDMTGKPFQSASVYSTNTVNFGFPYNGVQHARLTLRKHPRYGSDVLLEIKKGQFMAGVSGVQVLVRFDDNTTPMKFWASGAADHSSTTLFLGNYAKFVSQLRNAKIVRLSTPIYHEGNPVFEFNVAGFKEAK